MAENASRSRQFKNKGRGTDDGRRKRADASLELRKLKKDDQLMKRRNVAEADVTEPVSPLQERSSNVDASTMAMTMPEIIAAINCSDPEQHMKAVQVTRKILSRERNPPIDDFISAGLVPRLVSFLSCVDNVPLQFEAAWALTNIASGTAEQTAAVVKAGAIPQFVALLSSAAENVSEQAVWALGNIAGDGPHFRDYVIDAGAVKSLIALVTPNTKISSMRNIAWTLSNLCRNKNPPPPFESCCRCLPIFARMLHHDDAEVLSDTCWALSYITDGANEKIQVVLDSGVLPSLVRLLYHEQSLVVTPALRAIGNIVTGTDQQTQAVVDEPHALAAFPALLSHSKSNIRKEAAWAISNITAGSQSQIQAVIDHDIIPSILEVMKTGDFKSQKEAVWVITNLTSGGSLQQTAYTVDKGALPPLLELMVAKDPKTVLVVLDSINNILIAAGKHGQETKVRICLMIEELGGLDKLEALQEHDNVEIYQYALRLIETHFCEEADSDEALVPSQQTDQFQFSQPSTSSATGQGPSKFSF
ncbi:importin subunit alpha-5-like [Watersipora subatra]|uniref:importin subunit alpha-5-like n=1 Tax=Watersipora subatra TaxID=2589382 RepID=UPI00355C76AA